MEKHKPMNVLEEAIRIAPKTRMKEYGHPKHVYGNAAKMWSAILGKEVAAAQVCQCLIAVKLAREANRHKRDNLVDIAGYAWCAEMCD